MFFFCLSVDMRKENRFCDSPIRTPSSLSGMILVRLSVFLFSWLPLVTHMHIHIHIHIIYTHTSMSSIPCRVSSSNIEQLANESTENNTQLFEFYTTIGRFICCCSCCCCCFLLIEREIYISKKNIQYEATHRSTSLLFTWGGPDLTPTVFLWAPSLTS